MRPPPRSSAEKEREKISTRGEKERRREKKREEGRNPFPVCARETSICRLGQELKEGEGERVEILAISSIDPLPRFSLSLFLFSFSKPFLPVGRATTTLWTETCAEHGWKKQISTIAGGEFPLPLPAQPRFRFSDEGFRLVAFCPSPFERYRRPRHSVYSETLSV